MCTYSSFNHAPPRMSCRPQHYMPPSKPLSVVQPHPFLGRSPQAELTPLVAGCARLLLISGTPVDSSGPASFLKYFSPNCSCAFVSMSLSYCRHAPLRLSLLTVFLFYFDSSIYGSGCKCTLILARNHPSFGDTSSAGAELRGGRPTPDLKKLSILVL
jgi:hypothetical protein